MPAIRDSSWKRTAVLFAGHLTNDGYGGFLAPLLPLLIDRLGLSLALAGLLGTIYTVVNSASQPGLGFLIDRSGRPLLVALGPAITVCAMSLIGLAPSYGLLVVLMVVAGMGSALFHPAAAALVGGGDGGNRGLRMAFFSSGGTAGVALTPLLVVAFAQAFGLPRMPWLILPGLLATALLVALPLARAMREWTTDEDRHETPGVCVSRPTGRLALLWAAIVLRSLAGTAFGSFLAVLVTRRGASALAGGAAITVFFLAGVAGEFAAGGLSDRLGRKRILVGTIALSSPLLLVFLHGPSVLLWLALAASGFFLFASNPVGVVAAQECLPGRRGLVSGLVMGAAWGVGGIALTPIGRLADLYGLVPVMTGVAFAPLLAAFLLLFWREPPGIRAEDAASIDRTSRAVAGTEERSGGR